MLQFKTTKLQEMVSKAFKGVGNNKLKPITELIALKCDAESQGKLTMITTDGDNYMYVSEEPIEGEHFYAVVQANQFVKLISRLTSEEVTLNVVNNCLEVRGNGTYKIPLEIDGGTGEVVDYPDPVRSLTLFLEQDKIGDISAQDISTILRALKPSLATTVEIPQYIHYYMGETVLATDTNVASCYGKKLVSTPILVSAAVMDMLSVYSGDAPLWIYKVTNRLLFWGKDFMLLGYVMPGIDEFSVDKINDYLESEYPSMCQIPKQELLQALDRLSLFVNDFDEDTIGIAFTADGLVVSSKQSDSVETIPYIKQENMVETTRAVYLFMLSAQVKAQTGDAVDLYFGEAKSIKLVDSACNITSVVCLVG